MTPIFSAEIYVCYKRSNITINMALKVLSLLCVLPLPTQTCQQG